MFTFCAALNEIPVIGQLKRAQIKNCGEARARFHTSLVRSVLLGRRNNYANELCFILLPAITKCQLYAAAAGGAAALLLRYLYIPRDE
jgi:hypothetical protein